MLIGGIPDFEMQVWTERVARISGSRNHITFFYRELIFPGIYVHGMFLCFILLHLNNLANVRCKIIKVCIHGGVSFRVIYIEGSSISSRLYFDPGYIAIGNSINSFASYSLSLDIYSGMKVICPEFGEVT